MLCFRDFVPREIKAPGLFVVGDHENFEQAVEAANHWLATHRVRLVNLETVVLPNIWSRWEDGTHDADLNTSGTNPARWHQFLRVWYQSEETQPLDNASSRAHA